MIIDKDHPAAAYIIVKDAQTSKVISLVTSIDTVKGEIERLEYPEADAPKITAPLSDFDVYVNIKAVKYLKDLEPFEEGTPA